MRRAGQHLAVVVDEYGGTDGIVTLEDLIEEIAGEMVQGAGDAPAAVSGLDEAQEIDGRTNLDDLAESTAIELPPGPYDTVAGYLMARLGRLPAEGDTVVVQGRALTVLEMDGRRVARIAVGAVGPPAGTGVGNDQETRPPAEFRAGIDARETRR
jgi:putative hemolysin